MQLNPVHQASLPTYPVKTGKDTRSRLGRWMQRALAVACASGALWMGGCYGLSPYGTEEPVEPSFVDIVSVVLEQPPLPEDPEPMDGGMMAPAFSCGALSEWSIQTVPAWLDGSLCGEQNALAAVDVAEDGRYWISLSSGGEYVLLSVLDPTGEVFVELTPDATTVDVDLSPGRWTLVASPADPIDYSYSWFEVTVDYAD